MGKLETLSELFKQTDFTFGEKVLKGFISDLAIAVVQSDDVYVDEYAEVKVYNEHIGDLETYTTDTFEFNFYTDIADMNVKVEAYVSAQHYWVDPPDNIRMIDIEDIDIQSVKFYIFDNEFDLTDNKELLELLNKEVR